MPRLSRAKLLHPSTPTPPLTHTHTHTLPPPKFPHQSPLYHSRLPPPPVHSTAGCESVGRRSLCQNSSRADEFDAPVTKIDTRLPYLSAVFAAFVQRVFEHTEERLVWSGVATAFVVPGQFRSAFAGVAAVVYYHVEGLELVR